MTLPLISVIIPVYNGEKYIAEALDSVLVQQQVRFETIVIDDGSTDRSVEIVRHYPQVQLEAGPNRGVARARNRGLELASGEFVAYLDQDDRWPAEKLQVQLQALQSNPQLAGLLTYSRLFLEEGCQLPTGVQPKWLASPQPGGFPGTLLIRRSACERIGHFDPAFGGACDTEWFARAKIQGEVIDMLPAVLHEKRVHDNNDSNSQSHRPNLMRALHHSIRLRRRLAG